ncbi:MAG: hypothetical protein NTAFB05_27230 [Nitrobacter sp.]
MRRASAASRSACSIQALGAAAERGDRSLAHVVGVERGHHGEAAALFLRPQLGGGLRRDHRTRGAAAGTADHAGSLVLVAAVGGDGGRARRRRRARGGRCLGRRGLGLGFAEAALGFEFGLALGFLFLAVTLFLGLAAGLGGLALGLLDAFLAVAARGFGLGKSAFFLGADLGLGQRARARAAFVLGQCPQHHARTGARRG